MPGGDAVCPDDIQRIPATGLCDTGVNRHTARRTPPSDRDADLRRRLRELRRNGSALASGGCISLYALKGLC